MARPMKPLVRGGGYYPSNGWTPLVYAGGYTTANGGGEPPEPPIEKTVTGNTIHITDALAKPAQALSVKLEPIQDLNGYDNPWPAGGGKNKLPYATPIEIYGVNFTVASDGVVTLNGTSTTGLCDCYFVGGASGNYQLSGIPSGDYILSGGANGTSLYVVAEGGSIIAQATGTTSANVTIDSTTKYRIFLRAGVGVAFTNTKVYPMLRLSTISDATYSPYSNICPISGWTGANIHVSPTTDAQDGTTYSITFPSAAGTVYGGTLDVLTGVLTVDRVGLVSTSDNLNGLEESTSASTNDWLVVRCANAFPDTDGNKRANSICSHTKYKFANVDGTAHYYITTNGFWMAVPKSEYPTFTDFASTLTGNDILTCVAYIATPITIQLTPQQVELLQGENNVWSDGTMTLVYLADGNASDVEALNILLGGRYVNNHEADEPTDREALNIILGGNER